MATVGKQRTKKRRQSQGWGLALPQGHLAKPSTALATVSWGRGYRHPGCRPLPCAPADLAAGLILASTPLHSGPRSCHTDPAVRAAHRHTGVSGLSNSPVPSLCPAAQLTQIQSRGSWETIKQEATPANATPSSRAQGWADLGRDLVMPPACSRPGQGVLLLAASVGDLGSSPSLCVQAD